MNDDSTFKAICPLINFQISEVPIGNQTHKETMEYSDTLTKRLEQGIEIWKNAKIRRINEKDIGAMKKFGAINYWAGISRITRRSYVIEILLRSVDEQGEVLRKIYHLLLAMRLYKANDVFCKVIWYVDNAKIKSLTIIDPPVPEMMELPYTIQIDEIDRIKKITNTIDKIDFEKRPSIRIACERFSRSFEEHREDEKIIDFMIAFEALFLRGKTAPPNTGQFIGLGCSMLLGKNDKEREKINEFLVEAYKTRNKIVHGSEFVTPIKIRNKQWEIEDFISELQEYLRQSIKKLI